MDTRQPPLVSVCIPVFNGENYILECINSVLRQDYTNFELLILDNCSTDATPQIIAKIDDSRVSYVSNETNVGSIRNFTKCIEHAKGKYFLLLPHDDLLLPGSLAVFVRRLDDSTVGFVYSSVVVVDENGNTLYSKVNHKENQLFTCKEIIVDIVDFFNPIQLAMARTSMLKRLKGFDVEYGLFCDIHLWLRVVFDGWKVFYNSEPLSCHRVHSQQGQNAFLERNLDTLSKHWGEDLCRNFWIKNSYSYLFSKILKFIMSNVVAKGYDIGRLEIKLLKLFARSHLRSLMSAATGFNSPMLFQECAVFKLLLKQYGLRKILLCYPLVMLDFIKEKFKAN
jgi:glycosyltransferase involved in cell wall biosynthesis